MGSEKIRRGMINEDEFRKLVEVSRVMSESPLYIDQTGGVLPSLSSPLAHAS